MSDSSSDEPVRVNWATATIVLGLAEVVLFGFFLVQVATGLHESVDGVGHRVREAMIVGGEVSVAAALSVAALAARKRPDLLTVLATSRVVGSMVTLAYPFSIGWYYLLDPARTQLSAKAVFGLAIAHTLTTVLAAVTNRRPNDAGPPTAEGATDADPTDRKPATDREQS